MKTFLFKISMFTLACIVSCAVYADQDDGESFFTRDNGYEREDMDEVCALSAQLLPTMFDDINMSVSGTFLYWNIMQDPIAIGYANIINNTTTPTAISSLSIYQRFSYCPAFKIAIEYSVPIDDWSERIEYTRFHSDNTTRSDRSSVTLATNEGYSLRAGVGFVPPEFINNSASATNFNTADGMSSFIALGTIVSRWRLSMDLLDFWVTRHSYIGKSLVVSPYFGFRVGWINQEIDYTITDTQGTPSSSTSNLSSRSWVLGPNCNLVSKWMLGYGFRINTTMNFGLFYQEVSVKNDYPEVVGALRINIPAPAANTNNNKNAFTVSDKVRNVSPQCGGSMGIAWGAYMLDDSAINVDILLAYEFNIWLRQQEIIASALRNRAVQDYPYLQRVPVTETTSVSTTNLYTNAYNVPVTAAGFATHGLTLTVRVDM